MQIDPVIAINTLLLSGLSIIGSIIAGLIVLVVTLWTSRKRDDSAESTKKKLDDSAKLDKVYTLLVDDPEFGTKGLVSQVRDLTTDVSAIKFTLTTNGFKQPGGKDTVLDILQQTRHNTKPAAGETQPKKDEDGNYDHS